MVTSAYYQEPDKKCKRITVTETGKSVAFCLIEYFLKYEFSITAKRLKAKAQGGRATASEPGFRTSSQLTSSLSLLCYCDQGPYVWTANKVSRIAPNPDLLNGE